MLKMLFYGICAAVLLIPAAVSADQIRLTSFDNTVRLTGTFVGFRQDVYIIELNGHLVEIPIAGMICEGSDCLDFVPSGNTFARLEEG
ncbi:hypothetical protein SLH49_19145 [Cognatiyoonia sp. IB215446]|uniref:hypothetical protein n=1 Tax=Cognatiyoonia sp. IB215446 TaxID=3097355 RepID=UPI002A1317E4|nr:hypothetical protein [Cognatiyoonia sp. IB215446]MDX8350113.1 hypothetical protein [Cognatiyoonia sp. IB215446]